MRKPKEPAWPEYAPPRQPYFKLFQHVARFCWVVVKIFVKLVAIMWIFGVAFILALTWGK